MSDWTDSLNASVEGKTSDVLTKIKHKMSQVFGPGKAARIKEFEDNLNTSFSVSNLPRVRNEDLLSHYHASLVKRGILTVTMDDIAISTLVEYTLSQKQKHLFAILCGRKYTHMVNDITKYNHEVSELWDSSSDFQDSNFNEKIVYKRLTAIEKTLTQGDKITVGVTKFLDTPVSFNRNDVKTGQSYRNVIARLEDAMVNYAVQIDGTAILVEDLEAIIASDDVLEQVKRRAKVILTNATTVYKNMNRLDAKHNLLWQEWHSTQKFRSVLSDIYFDLKNMEKQMNHANETINWASSLTASTEAGGFAKIKDKIAKTFGIGDQKRVDNLRASTRKKLDTDSLLIVKDQVVSSTFYSYLKKQNKMTTTVGELSAFCLSAGLLKDQRNLQQSAMVASGRPSLPQFQKLPVLFKQIDVFVDNYTEDSVVDSIKKMNSLMDKIGSVYDSINVVVEYTKPVKASDIKKEVTYKQILDNHQNSVQIYWEAGPDTPFKIRDIAKKLKKQNSGNPAHVAALDDVLSRFDSLKEKLKVNAAHSWTMALEWMLVTNMEIKMANIYDDLRKVKANAGTESNQWALAISAESAEPTTVDSVMNEWGAATRGWQQGIEYVPGVESDTDKDMGEVSDGDHTFNELYMHRTTLFNIILCQNKDKAWKSKLHDDGTMFDDYFIAGIETPEGNFTYHQHLDFWDKFDVVEREKAPVWDGHKSSDITRLYSLL